MAGSPQSWQDVRSVRGLRSVERAVAAADVQALATPVAFQAIAPYRSFDSRNSSAPLPSGSEPVLTPWRDVDGVQRIPNDVAAVTFNLTVTETSGSGFVAVYPFGSSFPGVSSINWSVSGATVANNGTVRTGEGVGIGRHIRALVAGGRTHVILDVTGYFA